jgi:hypothetical protein
VFPFNVPAPLFYRVADRYLGPVSDHFSTFTGWTWASDATFSGAPADITNDIPSFIRLSHSTTSTAHFAHKVISSTGSVQIFGSLLSTGTSGAGLRIDDGTNNNFVEIRVTQGSAGAFFRDITAVRSLAGSVTSTVVAANLPLLLYSYRVVKTATNVQVYFHPSLRPILATLDASHTWTATRIGLVLRQSATAANVENAAWFDWVNIP